MTKPRTQSLRKRLLALARKWSKIEYNGSHWGYYPYSQCADELRAVLKGKK